MGKAAFIPAILLAASIVALNLYQPGTTIYHNDQGHLISNALAANRDGVPVMLGLWGNFGVRYGPVPSWFYQCALRLTPSLVSVARIKIAVTLAALLGALVVAAIECEISLAGCLLCLCGYGAFWSTRDLWDNCFLLPFGAALFVLVVSWVRKPSGARLAGILFCTWLLLHTHLMSLMLVAGMVPLGLWFRREFLLENKTLAAVQLLIFGASILPYLVYVLNNWSAPAGAPAQSMPEKLLFVLRIPEFYVVPESLAHSVEGYFPGFGPAFVGVWRFSYLVYGLYYAGMAITARDALSSVHRGWRQRIARIALLVVAFHLAFYLSTRAQLYSHYINAMWFVSAYFVGRGTDFVARWRPGRLLLAGYACASLLALASLTHYIALRGGIYNDPCLTNQMQAVRRVDSITRDGPVDIQVPFWQQYPVNFSTLRSLDQAAGRPPFGSGPGCKVVYRDQDQARSLWYTAVANP